MPIKAAAIATAVPDRGAAAAGSGGYL